MGESERRQYRSKASFGDGAPPNTLPFPKRANLTVIEILAFLPNRINCADVVYRMISNVGTRRSIHAIVNTHRDLGAEWSANCCGEAMYKTMQKAGYTKWTITQHNVWHDNRKALWDSNRLDVGDLRAAPGPAARSVSFRSLAENVRTMPQGDDTLDLTRMVLYCVQIAEDGWKYPRDYEELSDLLGGPAAVREANTDGAVFRRWENRKPPPPLPKPAPLLRGIEVLGGCKKTRRKSSAVAGRTGTETGSRKLSPAPRSLAKHGAARDGTAAIPENMDMVEVMYVSDPDSELSTHYVRQVAEYMPPPPQPNVEGSRTILTLALAFQAEGFVGESDIYSAYAFGGPRHAPPYRYLYQVTQPHPRDVSGWAVTLRWAFEQRVLFSKDFLQVAEWDESSAHMARIERERTQRVWASDELLEQLQWGG